MLKLSKDEHALGYNTDWSSAKVNRVTIREVKEVSTDVFEIT